MYEKRKYDREMVLTSPKACHQMSIEVFTKKHII